MLAREGEYFHLLQPLRGLNLTETEDQTNKIVKRQTNSEFK